MPTNNTARQINNRVTRYYRVVFANVVSFNSSKIS